MYEKVAEYLMTLSAEELRAIALEEIAICAAWFDSFRNNTEIQNLYAGLKTVFEQWVKVATPPSGETEGYRQQPLLRALISEVVKGNLGHLQRDELDLLYFAKGFAEHTGREDIFERPMRCLNPFLDALVRLREERPLCIGVPNLARRLTIVPPSALREAPAREIHTFAGLEADCTLNLLQVKGNTKVLGDIPEGTALAVEDGDGFISGSVLGWLACSKNAEIFGGVRGVAVARRGDLRCGKIHPRSRVIAKEGSVHSIEAAQPAMVYGAFSVQTKRHITGGKVLGRRISIAGEVMGGVIQTSERLQAEYFRATERQGLSLVLRRGFVCFDYGEKLPPEANKLYMNALRLRHRVFYLTQMIEVQEREIDQLAANILMYLFSERSTEEELKRLELLRCRIAYLNRLIEGAKAVIGLAEERLTQSALQESMSSDREEGEAKEDRLLFDTLEPDLAAIAREGAVDRELLRLRDQLLTLGQRSNRWLLLRHEVEAILHEAVSLLETMESLRNAAERQQQHIQHLLEQTMKKTNIVERARQVRKSIALLNEVVDVLQRHGTQSPLWRKINDRHVKLLRRIIETRMSYVAGSRATLQGFERQFAKIRDRLWDEFQISLPAHITEGWRYEGSEVIGRFTAGVRLCPWPHQAEESSGENVLITPDLPEVTRFRRTHQGTIERA